VKKSLFLALAVLIAFSAEAFAYVIKLKDGSLIFARTKYTVKGDRAIITLENGTVTALKLDEIDIDGSEKYNKENFGNVVALDTPEEKPKTLPTAPPRSNNPLGDLIKQRGTRMSLPTPVPAAAAATSGGGAEGGAVDSVYQATFTQVFEGTGISQFRVTNYRGKTRILVTADSEQAVFSTLSASARARAWRRIRSDRVRFPSRISFARKRSVTRLLSTEYLDLRGIDVRRGIATSSRRWRWPWPRTWSAPACGPSRRPRRACHG